MKIGIVEMGGNLNKLFQQELSKQMETVSFEVKKALDLLDVLAYARKMIALDQVVIIAEINSEDQEMKRIFLSGLAALEGETGKNIFKCFYSEDDDGKEKAIELAETFYNYLFHPDRLVKKEPEPEEFF